MLRDGALSLPPPGIRLAAPAPQTFHLCFGAHHVAVRSQVARVSVRLLASTRPMVDRSPRGELAGRLYVVRDGERIRVSGSAPDCEGIFRHPAPAARSLLHSAIKMMIAARPELLWLHAGVVARAGRAIVLCAASGQGKSTLVGEMLALGWTYLSDEIAPVDAATATVLAFPLAPYRRVSGGQVLTRPEEVLRLPKARVHLDDDAVCRTGALPIAGIYFLSFSPAVPATTLQPCSPSAAVIELLKNSLSTSDSRLSELADLSRLMTRLPATRIIYGAARDAAAALHTLPELAAGCDQGRTQLA